ncbi:hypothetical protein QFZ64_006098 [Streptomyces sp. B3I8]|nr:hypothetical protein [Streptomyces sp. B3I8]
MPATLLKQFTESEMPKMKNPAGADETDRTRPACDETLVREVPEGSGDDLPHRSHRPGDFVLRGVDDESGLVARAQFEKVVRPARRHPLVHGNGTRPALWDCNTGGNQLRTSTTTNQLTVYDSECLEVTGGATADGSPVDIDDCDGTPAQAWRVRADGSVVDVASGKCLDAVGQGTAHNTALDIWPCSGGSDQRWRRT